MSCKLLWPLWLCIVIGHDWSSCSAEHLKQPNIVMILADDMGFNDISLHGSNNIPTPNIDALGVFGVSLQRHYVAPMCSPSRSSLMSGKYPSSVGMQRYVIVPEQPFGIGLDEKLLPEYLKEVGYRTNMVGKWHLGFFRREYTPTYRGIDNFFGYWGPYVDYYNHSLARPNSKNFTPGYDMRKNMDTHWDTMGQYATDLFTDKAIEMIDRHDKKIPMFLFVSHMAPHTGNEYDPMQVPEEDLFQFNYIKDPVRRRYAAMMSRLDRSVGQIVQALDKNQMLNNTIIVFMADNGAPVVGLHSNSGSNYPFKGQKDSPWEGAVRSAAAVWSPKLLKRQRVSQELYHISDWLPTLCKLAGVPNNKLNKGLDGLNIWPSLTYNLPSPRVDALLIADQDEFYSSYIRGNYKMVNGSRRNQEYDAWLSSNYDNEENIDLRDHYGDVVLNSVVGRIVSQYEKGQYKMSPRHVQSSREASIITCNGKLPVTDGPSFCNPFRSPCLFNIVEDPCETTNLADIEPEMLRTMLQATDEYMRTAMRPRNQPNDPRSNPKFYNNTWTNWYDELPQVPGQASHQRTCTLVFLLPFLTYTLLHIFY